jgi:DNA polymerase-3 subunit alpha
MSDKTGFPPFTHLHTHSVYSVSEALSTPAEICAFAHLAGYTSVALTDTNGTFGFMEFHLEARKLGIKPIYGAVLAHEAILSAATGPFMMTVLAVSKAGLRNVCMLATLARNRAEESGALSWNEMRLHGDGVIFLCGGQKSELAQHILAERENDARELVETLAEAFGDRFFIEVQDHGESEERQLAQDLIALGRGTDVTAVLTNDVRFVGREKHELFDLLSDEPLQLDDRDFFTREAISKHRGMRTPAEMAALFEAYEEAYRNTEHITGLIEDDLLEPYTKSDSAFVLEQLLRIQDDAEKLFLDKVWRRFNLYFHYLDRSESRYYKGILESELDQILSEGLVESFLLFHEIISTLKREKVWLGPATGLNAQSLCAYLLNITSFNPYADDFAFKPILDRASMHTRVLEIQIATEDRGVVMRSLTSIFDAKHLAYVPGVEHLTPIRALKLASKYIEMNEEDLGDAVKIAMQHPGVSLMKLCEESRPLGALFKRSAFVRQLVKRAALLEGRPTGFIKSKRSLILSPAPIQDFLGEFTDRSGGDVFVQATKDAFPTGNVFRIDFTILGSLSVCMKTERELRKQRTKLYGWDNLPRGDEAVWHEVMHGESIGVYMLENTNVKSLCSSFGPQSIEDLIDFLALLRSRPDADSYAKRLEQYKSQKLPDCDYKPELMVVLGRMHGILLYEEQLRDIISILTGLGTGESYAMLQKFMNEDPGVLSTLRKEFMRHTANEDIPLEEAHAWFDKIHHYSSRMVSRQRVLADALLIYKMFYLKTYYQSHFFLSLLNTYWDNEAKVKTYLAYFHDRELLLPVDINRSELYFTLEDDKIRLGLHMIEGLSYPLLLKILNTRSRRRRFKNLEDFLRRMQGKGITVEDVGKLIMAGAFDFTGISRTNLMNALPELFEDPGAASTNGLRNQLELPFDFESHAPAAGSGSDLMDKILNEKSSVNHEVDLRKDYTVISVLEDFYSRRTASLVEIAGQVSNVQRLKTSSGKILGFFVLFDFSAFVHVFIPWDGFVQFGGELEEGKRVIVRGRVSIRDDKKVCEALALKAFNEGAATNGTKESDGPSESRP